MRRDLLKSFGKIFALSGENRETPLHGMGRAFGFNTTGEIILDFVSRVTPVLIAELYANAGRSVAFRTVRGDPDNFASYRKPFSFVYQIDQHEDLFAELVFPIGGYKQAPVHDKGHIRRKQRALVLDRQGEDSLPRIIGCIRHIDNVLTKVFNKPDAKGTSQLTPAPASDGH